MKPKTHRRKKLITSGPVHTRGNQFATWDDLLRHVQAGGQVRYQAPMDYSADDSGRYVHVKILANHKVRVDPLSRDADKFTADKGHLNRFRILRRK